MKYRKNLIILAVLFFLAFSLVSAHGLGQTISIDVDDYQIDVDLDVLDPEAGESIRFDFDLLDPGEKGLSTEFDYIWVRIQKGQKVVFAGGIGKPTFGPTGFTTILPEGGTHVISIRFQKEGQKIVEGSQNFDVASRGQEGSFVSFLFTTQFFFGLIIGLILGFLGVSVFGKSK